MPHEPVPVVLQRPTYTIEGHGALLSGRLLMGARQLSVLPAFVAMHVQDLFGEFPVNRFVAEHLHRLPLALPGVGARVLSLGTWPNVAAMLTTPGVDLMVVKQGARYDGPPPTDLATAQALSNDGYTLVIRHAERHSDDIAKLSQVFADAFRGSMDVHLYVTPPGSFGFSWHYDAEDVFILQTAGEKEYLLRKNTVNPWPLEDTMPADLHYEREVMPLMRTVLRAGDLLYIPCGYWHRAQTTESTETSISIAVGVNSLSAMDVFDLLRSELKESLVWRQRLPIVSTENGNGSNEYREHLKQVLELLAGDIARTMKCRPFLDRVTKLVHGEPTLPDKHA